MRQFRYYVDTSVWNFLLEKERPERRAITERFFDQLKELGVIEISKRCFALSHCCCL